VDVAIVGAFGSVGRQLAVQVLQRQLLEGTSRIQLVGHQSGMSEREMFGLRSDLADAFIDEAPTIEVGTDPSFIDADLVVMIAGATVPRTLGVPVDRSALAATNAAIFDGYARELARRDRDVTVIVQSNPVELGVEIFSNHLDRHRVLGAGAWNDTLRFRRELARDLGVRRPDVSASVVGEHGDHMVPLWSQVKVRGVPQADVAHAIGAIRRGRELAGFSDEIIEARTRILGLVADDRIEEAYDDLEGLSPDLRAAVKPFFIHFTSGSTTEVATAHAVADILGALLAGDRKVVAAQVKIEGEWNGATGVTGAQVILDEWGWSELVDMDLPDDESAALAAALDAVTESHRDLVKSLERPDQP
jgi:malate dehydrogenase